MASKTKTIDRSVETVNFREYWILNPSGGQSLYSRTSNYYEPQGWSYRRWVYRQYSTTDNWKSLRDSQGYLPSRALDELQESWRIERMPVWFWHKGWNEKQLTDPFLLTMPSYDNNYFYSAWYNYAGQDALVSTAKVRALSKARDMKVNLAVLFGEGRKTVNMITDTARTLARAYKAFRRGSFSKAARVLGIDKPSGAAANDWLAYSYGWKPLLADAKGLAETLAQHLEAPRKPRFSVSTKVVSGDKFSWNDWTAYNISWGDLSCKWRYAPREIEVRAGLLLEVAYKESALAAQLGVGLTDPLLLAWELIPFSFVFDWFISVGEWLESISALQGLTVLDGWTSRMIRVTGSPSVTPSGGWIVQGVIPVPKAAYRSYVREKWSGAPPVLPIVQNDPLNARRLVTTAALWRQRLRGDRV